MWSQVMCLQEGLIILLEKKKVSLLGSTDTIKGKKQTKKSLNFSLNALSDSRFFRLSQMDVYEREGLHGAPAKFVKNP